MARNGYPDEPGNYSESEPTQYADFGGTGGQAYSEYGYTAPTTPVGETGRYPAAAPAPTPWHQRPVVLVSLGALTAAVLALLVYAVVQFTNAGNSQSPAVTSSSVATTPSVPTTAASTAEPSPAPQTATGAPSTTAAPPPPPTTVTTTVTPTTTEAPAPSTTTSVTTSVTTVTETTTRPLFPNWPRPTRPTLLEPPAEG